MALGRSASLAAGLGSTVGLGLLVALVVVAWEAPPLNLESPGKLWRRFPSPGAWVWAPQTSLWRWEMFVEPLQEPRLHRAQDGSAFVVERSDAHRHLERFDGSGFVRIAEEPTPEPNPPDAGAGAAMRVAGGTWLSLAREGAPETLILRSGVWAPGPILPEGFSLSKPEGFSLPLSVIQKADPRDYAAEFPGGRLVALCQSSASADGGHPWLKEPEEKYLCTARAGESRFAVLTRLPFLGNRLVAMAPTRTGQLLMVIDGTSHLGTEVVDLDSGAVKDGPELPGVLATTRLEELSEVSLDDGGLLLAPVIEAGREVWSQTTIPVSALAVLVPFLAVAGLAKSRRWLSLPWFMAGVLFATLSAGALVALVFVLFHGTTFML